MATPEAAAGAEEPRQVSYECNSHNTALCLVPPESTWTAVEHLRALYDKSYQKWPPHVNLLYPFVHPESLDGAARRLQTVLAEDGKSSASGIDIRLDTAGVFHQRHEKTLFLHDGREDGSLAHLRQLRASLVAALGGKQGKQGKEQQDQQDQHDQPYQMHMTVAQSDAAASRADGDAAAPKDTQGHAHRFLRHKVERLPPVAWQADRLHILVRERISAQGGHRGEPPATSTGRATSRMRLWGVLHMADGRLEKLGRPAPFYSPEPRGHEAHSALAFVPASNRWARLSTQALSSPPPSPSLSIASYNVLAEFEWPPSQRRVPLLVRSILSAQSDVLALQEVTDHVLSALLADRGVQAAYPYVSHGPPDQPDLEPLPSLLNVVVLSRHPFVWSRLDFHRPHKSAIIARLGGSDDRTAGIAGAVVAAVHLTHGLTTGSVAAKQLEIQTLIGCLDRALGPSADPVVLAGDWNIHTSSLAMDAAVERRTITPEAAQLAKTGLDALLAGAGYVDAWSARQAAGDVDDDDEEDGDEYGEYDYGGCHQQKYPGEEGATYDTLTNALAAQITGHGLNNRPQRFDRILVRRPAQHDDGDEDDGPTKNKKSSQVGRSRFRIAHFGKFGYAAGDADDTEPDSYASDHWGIRCVLERVDEGAEDSTEEVDEDYDDDDDDDDDDNGEVLAHAMADVEICKDGEDGAEHTETAATYSDEIAPLVVPVVPVRAASPATRADGRSTVEAALAALGAIPSDDETAARKHALDLLRSILILDSDTLMGAGTDAGAGAEAGTDAAGAGAGAAAKDVRRQLVLVPAGSYGLGVWTPASDVDCLCIGAYAPSTFFALARQRLRAAAAAAADPASVKIIRRVQAHTGTMLELEVHGIRMDLQYCQAPLLAETWPAVLVLPPSHEALQQLSPQTLSKLKAVRDVYYLRKSFPPLPSPSSICTAAHFGTAHRAIKTWACHRGLYAARFGYLSGIQISVLLARVMKLMDRDATDDNDAGDNDADEKKTYTLPDILTTFFHHYAHFDWATQMAFDPFFHRDRRPYRPTAREPMVVLGFHRPQLNTAGAASAPSVHVLAEEFRHADRLLGEGGITWKEFLGGGPPGGGGGGGLGSPGGPASVYDPGLPPGAAAFVRAYRTYVKIDLQYWGLSLRRGAAFVGWLESRCVLLLVDLARRLPALHARIWPGRFMEGREERESAANASPGGVVGGGGGGSGASRQYQGFYLVGLDLPATMPRDERQRVLGALLGILDTFAKQIQRGGENQSYDPQWQWLGVGTVNRQDLWPDVLRLDHRPWGRYAVDGEAEDDDDDDDGQMAEQQEQDPTAFAKDDDDNDEGDPPHRAPAKTKKSTGKGGKKGRKGNKDNKDKSQNSGDTAAEPGVPGPKFRTAQDVIQRMRWDPHLDRSDYLVGYEDRFAGPQERPLEAWKSEQTDEEFIPQHRVLYFKRRSDGVVVWDRKLRKDDVFGSGRRRGE